MEEYVKEEGGWKIRAAYQSPLAGGKKHHQNRY